MPESREVIFRSAAKKLTIGLTPATNAGGSELSANVSNSVKATKLA